MTTPRNLFEKSGPAAKKLFFKADNVAKPLFLKVDPIDDLLALMSGKPGVIFDPSRLDSMFKDHLGLTPVTADSDRVGLILDLKEIGDTPVADFIAASAEIKADGTTFLSGTASAATYNTSTGEGATSRVDSANLSGVRWLTVAVNSWVLVDIENTGSNEISVRDGAGNVWRNIPAGARSKSFVRASGASRLFVTGNVNDTSSTFTIHSVKVVPGNHAAQSAETKRPLWKSDNSLLFDGVDDCLIISTLDLTSVEEVTCVVSLYCIEINRVIFEHGTQSISSLPAFGLVATANSYTVRSGGTSGASDIGSGVSFPSLHVVGTEGKISTDTNQLYIDGALNVSGATDQGTGNYGDKALNIGARNNGTAAPASGNLYFYTVSGQLNANYRELAESIAAKRAGISL